MKRAQLAIVVTFDATVTTKEEAVKTAEESVASWIFGNWDYQTKIIEEPWIDEKYDRDSWIEGGGKE